MKTQLRLALLVFSLAAPAWAEDLRLEVFQSTDQKLENKKRGLILSVVIKTDRIPNDLDLNKAGGKLAVSECRTCDEVFIRAWLPGQDLNGPSYWSGSFERKKVLSSCSSRWALEGTSLEGKGPGQRIRSSLTETQEMAIATYSGRPFAVPVIPPPVLKVVSSPVPSTEGEFSVSTIAGTSRIQAVEMREGVLFYIGEDGIADQVALRDVVSMTLTEVNSGYYDYPQGMIFRKSIQPTLVRVVGISDGKIQYRLGDVRGDYKMQDVTMAMYFRDFESVRFSRPKQVAADVSSVNAGIHAKAAEKWPDDFAMQEWEIKRQIEAYRRLQSGQ